MFSQVVLLIWWIALIAIVIHLLYKKLKGNLENFAGKAPKIPRLAIPLIVTAIFGFCYVSFLSIAYIFNPEWAFNLFLPIKFLDINIIKTIGSLIVIIGTIVFLAAYFNLGSSTRLLLADSSEATHLKKKGLYSISRNPLYLGLHASLIGFCFIIPTWPMIILTIIFLINQDFRIRSEEKELEKHFGKEYLEYKQKVFRYFGRKRIL